MSNNLFSIIIPAYSEEENINQLLVEIEKTFKDEVDLEVILVDDLTAQFPWRMLLKKVNTNLIYKSLLIGTI